VKVLDSSSLKLLEKTAVALGMFDGVHIGHKTVIQCAVDYARNHKIKSAVITLANHPRELTQGEAPDLITDVNARLKIFEDLGLDYVLVLKFDNDLMRTSAEDYLQQYLVDILNVKFISTGYDHHFGSKRKGDVALLKSWTQQNQVELVIVGEIDMGDEKISSSKIRQLISSGKIQEANALLGHKFKIRSTVIKGRELGRELGFPTANLRIPKDTILPADGVYSATCSIDGIASGLSAVVNIGVKPSIGEALERSVEVHILQFDQDIYGKIVDLEFEARIRDEKKFDTLEDLKKQISEDILLASKL
jgi:riboflavin kinase / FMN adenylyltransferase